jgi:hypothetical protein
VTVVLASRTSSVAPPSAALSWAPQASCSAKQLATRRRPRPVHLGLNVVELLLIPAGIGPYLPFGLVGSLMGRADNVLVLAAMSLLLACLPVLALAVGKWAPPGDLT